MQLDTPESVKFPKPLCFMRRFLASVFLTQREVTAPSPLAFFSLQARTSHPPRESRLLPKHFEDLRVQWDLSVQFAGGGVLLCGQVLMLRVYRLMCNGVGVDVCLCLRLGKNESKPIFSLGHSFHTKLSSCSLLPHEGRWDEGRLGEGDL